MNDYAKSRHGIANGVNDGGWAKPSDAANGKESVNVSVVSASASAVDAKDEEGHEVILKSKGQGNTHRCVARGLQVPSDHHRPRACFEL